MNRESERERIRTEHEGRTVGRYACKHGAWEPVENDPAVVAHERRVIEDAAYLMAAHYCSRTKICEACPVASECMHPENIEKPAALLCRHFRSQAECKRDGEVPSWT